jgi:hypothetical protein
MVVEAFATVNGCNMYVKSKTHQIINLWRVLQMAIITFLPKDIMKPGWKQCSIKASTLLYEGSSISMLSTLLLLLSLRTIHGVNNSFMDELFSLL